MKYLITILLSTALLVSCNGNKPDTSPSDINTPEQLKQLNAQLLSNPDNADLYYKRAKYYLNENKLSEGLNDLNRAISIDSTKAEYFISISDLYFITNKTGDSKKALEKAIQLDNKNTDAILKLAELYLYVRKNEKSMEYINMALKISENNAKAYFMKGMNYKDMKDTVRAISSMQTAVEQDQQYYHAYIQLGILHAAKKNPLAVQYYKNAIRIQPKSLEAWYDLGKYHQDTKDWHNALAAYTTMLKIDPNNRSAHYNMAVIYLLELKNAELAIEHFTQAINANPKYVEAYYGRGIAYETKGDIETAVLDFQACLSLNPKYEPAQQKLELLNTKK